MNEAELQVRKIEALLSAYMKTIEAWSRATVGENKAMIARALDFLQKRLKELL